MFGKKNIGKVIVVFTALLLVGGFFVWKKAQNSAPAEAATTYDGNRFFPETITIKKGGVAVFINKSGKDFWPASDFHPSNGAYPDFDAKSPIASGETWEFTFEEAGEWGYHDHLSAFNKGMVIVREGPSLFQKSLCRDIGELNYRERELCWYKEMKKEIQKTGIGGALKLLAKLYAQDPLFGQGCHDITHLIGDEAYRQFKSGKNFDLGKETGYCGWGFYHGFIEALLYTSGDYKEARDFCQSLGESSHAIQSCYHGIGHSTFDIHDPNLWGSEAQMVNPAIAVCEAVTGGLSEQKTKQCVTGVFNALGIAYSNQQYQLKLRPEDPVWFCRGFNSIYKRACFVEVAMSWIHQEIWIEDIDFKKAASFIEGLRDKIGEEGAMDTLASEYTRLNIGSFNVSEMVGFCRSVKKTLFDACMNGAEEGFFLWGKPEEEYKLAFSFCASDLLAEREQEKCFQKILGDVSAFYSPEKRKTICENELDSKYEKLCL